MNTVNVYHVFRRQSGYWVRIAAGPALEWLSSVQLCRVQPLGFPANVPMSTVLAKMQSEEPTAEIRIADADSEAFSMAILETWHHATECARRQAGRSHAGRGLAALNVN